MYSRRDFERMVLFGGTSLAVADAKMTPSIVNGVKLGFITYRFPRAENTDGITNLIQIASSVGLSYVELGLAPLQPMGLPAAGAVQGQASAERVRAAEEVRKWRLTAPLGYFKEARKRLGDAGVDIIGLNHGFRSNMTDEDLDRAFEIANALGVNLLTSVFSLDVAERVAPFADKHKMYVTLHGHDVVDDPLDINTPSTFAQGLRMSKYFRINLDIGHFRASGCDSIKFIREHHDQITHLHLKDRRKDHGPDVPMGQGDTPIKEVLALLEEEKWPMFGIIEFEYPSTAAWVEELRNCSDYCRRALA